MAGIARVEGPAALVGEPERGPSQLTVRPRQVGALLWLRWTVSMRTYQRRLSSIIGGVAMLVFILGIGVAVGFLTGAGYLRLPRAAGAELLFATLTLLYIGWAALPVVQYSVNEGLDVTRLATYPLTQAERMVGLTLATLMDPPTFIIAAIFTAALVGWGAGPLSVLIGVMALLLLYVHTIGLSQMIVAGLIGLLRSRRYRDLSIVIFALMSVACSLSGQFATTLLQHAGHGALLSRLDIGRYAQWTPPGMAARAIILAHQGETLAALPWLALLLALTPLLLAAWAWTLDRGVTSPETAGGGGRARRARAIPAQAAGATSSARRHWISPVVAAVAVKDLRYMWRDPQIKASLLSSLVLLFVVFAPGLVRGDRPPPPQTNYFYEHLAGLQPMLAPLPALLIVITLSVNALGLERQGLQTLLLFPAKPLAILWGKNLAVAAVALAAQAVLIAASCAVTGAWAPGGPLALVEGVAATLTLLGAGNITSTLLPLRVRSLTVGANNLSSENGCLRSVISLGALWGTFFTLTPVFILLLVPPLLGKREWLIVAAPLAVLYGLALYQIATRLIARRLERRAPEIVALATRED